MFKTFVFATGIYDFLLGFAILLSAILGKQPAVMVMTLMVGAFLIFCGAVLTWASKNIAQRAPVIFWQGMVRVFAVIVIICGVWGGFANVSSAPMGIIDAIIAPIYFIGIARVTGIPAMNVFLGRTA